jgi:hypothetical protein
MRKQNKEATDLKDAENHQDRKQVATQEEESSDKEKGQLRLKFLRIIPKPISFHKGFERFLVVGQQICSHVLPCSGLEVDRVFLFSRF